MHLEQIHIHRIDIQTHIRTFQSRIDIHTWNRYTNICMYTCIQNRHIYIDIKISFVRYIFTYTCTQNIYRIDIPTYSCTHVSRIDIHTYNRYTNIYTYICSQNRYTYIDQIYKHMHVRIHLEQIYILRIDIQTYTRTHASVLDTGLRRPIGCLIFIGHFPQKSPIFSGFFTKMTCNLRHPMHFRHAVSHT